MDVFSRTKELQNMRDSQEAPGDMRRDAEMKLKKLEHENRWKAETTQRLINLCRNPREAQILYNGITESLSGMAAGRAMSQLREELIAKTLLSREDAKTVDCQLSDLPEVAQYLVEERSHLQSLHDEIAAILVACGIANKRDALRLYNEDHNRMSAHKIAAWKRNLVQAGLLSKGWKYKPGKTKMRKTWANKMMSRAPENK